MHLQRRRRSNAKKLRNERLSARKRPRQRRKKEKPQQLCEPGNEMLKLEVRRMVERNRWLNHRVMKRVTKKLNMKIHQSIRARKITLIAVVLCVTLTSLVRP